MLVMSALGLHGVPKADVAIFADTGDEPKSVYDTLEFYEKWAKEHGVDVAVVSAGHLSQDIIYRHNGSKSRVAAIPSYTVGEDGKAAMLRRQCTREYKIDPIEREVKRRLGYRKGQVVKKKAMGMIGITTDEIVRMKPSRTRWIESTWPLVDADLSRRDCIRFIKQMGLPTPARSACVFCPYHHDEFWHEMKENDPESFEEACRIDEAVRDMSMSGIERPVFLHRSLKPLREVSFLDWKRPGQLRLFDGMNQECEGMCGV